MYHGEAAIHLNSVNMLLENAKDLQIKQLADCFATGNTFDHEDQHTQSKNAEFGGNVENLESHEDSSEYRNSTKSISSTIDEILSLDLAVYSPDMDEPDSGNQLHKCGECGAGYKWKHALVRHIRSKHEGVRYPCNQCEYQATTQGSLKTHKESIHEGVKYSCNKCEFHATQKGDLKRHREAIHEGVKYSCNQCEFHATQKGHLQRHKESIHEGVVYSCNQCEYQATWQTHLQRHKEAKHKGKIC